MGEQPTPELRRAHTFGSVRGQLTMIEWEARQAIGGPVDASIPLADIAARARKAIETIDAATGSEGDDD